MKTPATTVSTLGTVVFSGIMAGMVLQQFGSAPSVSGPGQIFSGNVQHPLSQGINAFSARSDDMASMFGALASAWKSERSLDPVSSIDEVVASKNYQSIIGLGDAVVPLILAQLKREGSAPDHWFPALTQLTGASPVPREDRGRITKMANAWLAWGEARYG